MTERPHNPATGTICSASSPLKTVSSMEYAISGREEASAYLQHPLLGARLKQCTQLVLQVEGRYALDIFGTPDDMKFRSCMTLFAEVSPDDIFQRALQKYFDGDPDQLTLDRL